MLVVTVNFRTASTLPDVLESGLLEAGLTLSRPNKHLSPRGLFIRPEFQSERAAGMTRLNSRGMTD